MTVTPTERKTRSKRKVKRRVSQPPAPKSRRCPYCELEISISKIPTKFIAHLRAAHNRTPTFEELNLFVPPKKPVKIPRPKKRRLKGPKRFRVDRSLFVKNRDDHLTQEQVDARERLNRRGFHEGAAVPGSSVRRISK